MNKTNTKPLLVGRTGMHLGRHPMLHRKIYQSYAIKGNQKTEDSDWNNWLLQKQRIAFHLAGHSTAIYLNIKAKNLPPVFFKILFKSLNNIPAEESRNSQTIPCAISASLKCGRLAEMLPAYIEALTTDSSGSIQPSIKQNLIVYEADIVSLLAGSIAEAKHVANIDNEVFSPHLINLKALKYYGGHSDLPLVHDYLLSFSDCQQKRDEKLEALFDIAFDFISDPANWAAITKLACFILASQESHIDDDPGLLHQQ